MPASRGPRLAIVGAALGAAVLITGRLKQGGAPPLLMAAPPTRPTKVGVLLAGVGTAGTSTPGGQRNVGRLFAELLAESGADVGCIARSAAAAEELEAAGLRVVGTGDLTDATFAAEVLEKARPLTLFTAVGGKDATGGRVDGVANINLFRAAAAVRAPPHVVFVTSWGCGETFDFLDDGTRKILGPALRAKTEAEAFLRGTGLKHMIVRPGGLMPSTEPATKRGVLIRDRPDVGGAIRRQDLAQMLLWLPRRAETNGLAVTALDVDMLRAKTPLKDEDLVPLAAPGE